MVNFIGYSEREIKAEDVMKKFSSSALIVLSKCYQIYHDHKQMKQNPDGSYIDPINRILQEANLSIDLIKTHFRDKEVRGFLEKILSFSHDIVANGHYGGIDRAREVHFRDVYPEAYAGRDETLLGRPGDEYRQSMDVCAKKLDDSYMHPDGP